MRKFGPDPLPKNQLRSHRVSVYLSVAERTKLARLSGGNRQIAAYLRDAGLDRIPPQIPLLNREAWIELARLAANFNQLAHRANEGKSVCVDSELLELVSNLLSEVRRNLIGVEG